jgi:hypothetical protein
MEVSGLARTDSGGKIEFLLSEYFCLKSVQFQYPLNMVATARSAKPITASVEIALTSDWRDAEVSIASWNLVDGSPAPDTSVFWNCRIPYPVTID